MLGVCYGTPSVGDHFSHWLGSPLQESLLRHREKGGKLSGPNARRRPPIWPDDAVLTERAPPSPCPQALPMDLESAITQQVGDRDVADVRELVLVPGRDTWRPPCNTTTREECKKTVANGNK